MNNVVDSAEHAAVPAADWSADNGNREVQGKVYAKQKGEVSYEYEGYQVRVYFDGNRTLKQCIKNLIERKTGG